MTKRMHHILSYYQVRPIATGEKWKFLLSDDILSQ